MSRLRQIIADHPITAIVLAMVLVGAFGFLHTEQVVKDNHHQFCTVSISRWVVQRDVITTFSQHVANPPGTPLDAQQRIAIRNSQLDAQRDKLLTELGGKPKPC